jgi:putative DNA primase/helicase
MSVDRLPTDEEREAILARIRAERATKHGAVAPMVSTAVKLETVAVEHNRLGPLPELIVNEQNPSDTAKRLAVLIAERTDFLFNGNAPIRVAAETGHHPKAIEVTEGAVRHLAHEICVPTKIEYVKAGPMKKPVPLSTDIAGLYLDLEGRWSLSPFRGITSSPILSADGTIRTASGYDDASGLWCHNIPGVGIPERPSKEEAHRALGFLRTTFRTFPFEDGERILDAGLGVEVINPGSDPGLDESTSLAALMTAVCRQSLELAPGFLCDAPNYSGAGTGKGLLVKAICIVASGVRPSAFTSGHNEEELDKRLTAGLVEAQPSLFLDNFNAKNLRSDILASALTENPAKVRVMGQTKNVPLYVCTFIGITGNGVAIAEDMARRLLVCRLDARMENPEQRPFKPGFLDRIFASRTAILSACLTIWRWGRQNTVGMPRQAWRASAALPSCRVDRQRQRHDLDARLHRMDLSARASRAAKALALDKHALPNAFRSALVAPTILALGSKIAST